MKITLRISSSFNASYVLRSNTNSTDHDRLNSFMKNEQKSRIDFDSFLLDKIPERNYELFAVSKIDVVSVYSKIKSLCNGCFNTSTFHRRLKSLNPCLNQTPLRKACTPERKSSDLKVITLKYPEEEDLYLQQQETENEEILHQISELAKDVPYENEKVAKCIAFMKKAKEQFKDLRKLYYMLRILKQIIESIIFHKTEIIPILPSNLNFNSKKPVKTALFQLLPLLL